MGSRLVLHDEFKMLVPNVYFQPPSNLKMEYPCIVYSKIEKVNTFADDKLYSSKQGYRVMLIERDPESNISDIIERSFQHCSIGQYYTVDNLNHTILTLYY